MFKKIVYLFFVCLFVIVGCEQSTFNKVKLSDVTEFTSETEGITVPGRLVFEVPSQQQFVRSSQFLESTLNKYFLNVRNISHMKQGLKDYAVADIDVLVIHNRSNVAPPYYFTIKDSSSLFLNLNPNMLSALHVDIKSAFDTGLNAFMDIHFHFIVENDSGLPTEIEVPATFVDFESVEHGSVITLNNKESVTITCSNAMVDLASKQEVQVFTIIN